MQGFDSVSLFSETDKMELIGDVKSRAKIEISNSGGTELINEVGLMCFGPRLETGLCSPSSVTLGL